MTTFTEGKHAGSCIISEANGNRSRENVTLIQGQDLEANTVLGLITASGKYTAHDNNASDGSQVAKAILISAADSTDGDMLVAVLARDCEVIGEELSYKTTSPAVDEAAVATDLAAVGIIVRPAQYEIVT